MAQLDWIAAMAFGLEAIVADELRDLGYKSKVLQNGRVLFRANLAAMCRANLWLRTADRVLLRLATFPASDFGQLFDGTAALAWEAWLPRDAAFPVTGRSVKSQLSSVPACQKIVKKAIVERLRKAYHCQTLPETSARYTVEVAIVEDQASLTLDTTGPGLNKRGYRTLVGEAQLKETLAAAMILLSSWEPGRPLIDPFCGTGTIPIEAALIARNIAPGGQRSFAAESWPSVPAELWQQARQEAAELAQTGEPLKIVGSDINDEALGLARYHARRAGVAGDVHFQRCDFRELSSRDRYGSVICNPPYGERLGQRQEVEALYRDMPVVLSRLETWSHGILTSHKRFEKLVGRRADRRRKLYNGQIECFYYQFDSPSPSEPDRPPAFSRSVVAVGTKVAAPSQAAPTKLAQQREQFAATLANRARHLRRWPTKRGIACYRLYERDVPEVPLVVDRYEDLLHLVELPRPHDRSAQEHEAWLQAMAQTAADTLDVPRENARLKTVAERLPALYEAMHADRNVVTVPEHELRFRINLMDYADTGLALDERNLRTMVRQLSAGKRVLDLFAYTGTTSVAAALGGAADLTTVELHAVHRHWCAANFLLNGATSRCRLVADDALSFLESHEPGGYYDLVIVTPPLTSDRRDWAQPWDLLEHSVPLLRRLAEVLLSGTIVFFLVHHRRFQLPQAQLPQYRIHDITRQTIPDDFRNRRIHRCWRLVRI